MAPYSAALAQHHALPLREALPSFSLMQRSLPRIYRIYRELRELPQPIRAVTQHHYMYRANVLVTILQSPV